MSELNPESSPAESSSAESSSAESSSAESSSAESSSAESSSADEECYPWTWWVKRHFRKSRSQGKAIIGGIVRYRPFALIAPWAVSAYLLALDIFGDRWGFIKDYPDFHEWGFWIAVSSTMIVLFLRGIMGESRPLDSAGDGVAVLSEFITTVGAIVQAKSDRLRKSIPGLKPNSDKLKHCSDPLEQIKIISNALSSFIARNYGLNLNQIDITIIRRKHEGPWHFHFCHQRWTHTMPPKLMKEASAAASCLLSGESEFYPDKIEAANAGKYLLSARDKRRGDGSVFVYPVTIDMNTGKIECVVSIVTYGTQLCETYSTQSVEITKAFLSEICRRFEVELCLDAIRSGC